MNDTTDRNDESVAAQSNEPSESTAVDSQGTEGVVQDQYVGNPDVSSADGASDSTIPLASEAPHKADNNHISKSLALSGFKSIVLNLLRVPYVPLVILLVCYAVLNGWMTFSAEYKNYLFSDMFGYLNRPIRIFVGDEKAYGSWVGFAPFYSRILATPYAWMVLLGIEKYFVEFILVLNILMSVISGFALYSIAKIATGKRVVGLCLAGAYLFSYPHLYFNAFVLTEPFTVPLIITCVWLMMIWRCSYKIIICGFLLAVAVGIRPSNGFLGLPFALYIFLAGVEFKKRSIKEWWQIAFPRGLRAAAFSIAFFTTIFVIVAENSRVSDGRMKGLTSHSGYNYLLGQAQVHRIFSSWDGITYVFVPASVAHHPELGTLRTSVPIYDSKRFFEEGNKILDAYPQLWLEHAKKYKYLFFDNLFPAVPAHPGFFPFMNAFRFIVFYMFFFCGLTYITLKEKDAPRSVVYFSYAAFFLPAASLYMFTVTHKYFFNFSYTVFILFVFGIYSAIIHFKKYRKFIYGYIAFVVLSSAAYGGYRINSIVNIDRNLLVTVSQNSKPIRRLDDNRDINHSETFYIDRLEFFERHKMEHPTLGKLDFKTNFFMDVETEMEVLKQGAYRFTFFVDDGYEVTINGDRLMGVRGPVRMADGQIFRSVVLDPGVHKIKIRMYQGRDLHGLAGYYRREDTFPPVPGLIAQPKMGRGLAIGIDDKYTRFQSPSR